MATPDDHPEINPEVITQVTGSNANPHAYITMLEDDIK
jgi:hypothetical protein